MRQLNFLMIFLICLGVVLFALENHQFITIKIIPGVTVQTPLSVALLLAIGLGAVIAWVYSLWTRFLQMLQNWPQRRQVRQKEVKIQALEQDIERYKAELETQNYLPAAQTAEVIEAREL